VPKKSKCLATTIPTTQKPKYDHRGGRQKKKVCHGAGECICKTRGAVSSRKGPARKKEGKKKVSTKDVLAKKRKKRGFSVEMCEKLGQMVPLGGTKKVGESRESFAPGGETDIGLGRGWFCGVCVKHNCQSAGREKKKWGLGGKQGSA